ncbi:hypothetical protein [Moorena producens]|uniref:hypothetical protein n=1 Tax=Moorena producens TaxID=1155739 RepID=UPI00143B4C66|nr:hypothetical protein [Moorena producens]
MGRWGVWEVWGDGEMGRWGVKSATTVVIFPYLCFLLFTIPCSRFPVPDSRFPIPDSRFPIPDSLYRCQAVGLK